MTTLTEIVAKHDTPCAWCRGPIPAGDKAVERKCRFPGEKTKAMLVHPKCNAAMERN